MRTTKEVREEYYRYWDKVWWNRHWSVEHEVRVDCCSKAHAIEDRWGKEFLHPGNDIEWGITQGRMMALAWVLGREWEESGDT